VAVARNVFDEVAYPAHAFANTHPDQLAVMAALHGFTAAPPAKCRVLEIGCNEGANLIPMAFAMPGSEFTGFDLAALPIARGQQRIGELSLRNIRLFEADICDVHGLEEFDYIVAHGVYTWVPENVREHLLALCSRHLAPSGIACVSYNALPGSHLRNIARDALRWGGQRELSPEHQVAAGLELLHLAARSRPAGDIYRRLLEERAAKIEKRSAAATYHDELAPAYEAISILELLERARDHGLEYLSEAELPHPSDPALQPEVAKQVVELAGDDCAAQEYVFDFIRMRMFRETMLVRSGRSPQHKTTAAALPRMRFTSALIATEPDQPSARAWLGEDGTRVNCTQEPVVAAVDSLTAAWPRALAYVEVEEVLTGAGLLREQVPGLLLQMAMARLLHLHLWEAPVVCHISERPRASAASRQEVLVHPHVANLWHKTVQFCDPPARALLLLLDGQHDRSEILRELRQQFPSMDPAGLEKALEPNLERFLRAALLDA